MKRDFAVYLLLALVIGLFVFWQPAAAQKGDTPAGPGPTGPGATGPGGPTGPGGRTTTPGNQNPFPSTNDRQNPFPEMQQRPIFLSGKVLLDDGTPPPESLVIERVCNGVVRPEAYTDSKGRFSFELGKNMGMMQDASVNSAADDRFGASPGMPQSRGGNINARGGFGERDLMGCELRANLAGFRSDTVNLFNRRAFDNPDVGTIVLHRMGNVDGTTISATSLQAPKDARKAFEKGRDAFRKKKVAEAQKELEKAVEAYPRYASAWLELGRVNEAQQKLDEAKKCYAQSIAADGKYVNPYLQMAAIAVREQNWQDVADTTQRAIKLDPFNFPQAYLYNAIANYNLKHLDAAEKSAREGQKMDNQHRYPKLEHVLGVLLAEKQDFSAAAEHMRSYLKFAPDAQDAGIVKKQLTEIEKLSSNGKITQEAAPVSEPRQ